MTTRRPSPRSRFLGTALTSWALGLTLAACGGEPAPPAPATSAGEATSTAPGPASAPSSAGVLEVVSPQDPERPFFHDFGEMDFGTEVQWAVTLRNTGNEPVEIQRAQPACGCTRLVSFEVIGPDGESASSYSNFKARPICSVPAGGSIKMRVDILSKHSKPNLSKLALVRLSTNSSIDPFHTFELRFLGLKPFIVAPDNLTLHRVPVSHGAEVSCRVQVVKPGLPGLVHRIISAPEGIDARLDAKPFAGETVWTVTASVPPLSPMGTIRGDIVLAVSDEEGLGEAGRVTIPVAVRVGPDAFLDPGMFTFGAVKPGETRLRQAQLIGLVPGAKLEILGARLENASADAFRISYRAAGPDEGGQRDDSGRSNRWIIDVQLTADHPEGYLTGEIVLTLSEPIGGGEGEMGTELRARISGLVRP